MPHNPSPAPDVAASVEPPAPSSGDDTRLASVGEAHDLISEGDRHRCVRCGAESVGAAPPLPCATLADFLLARIAEDESLLDPDWLVYGGKGEVWTTEAVARVRAECEAKRKIIEQWDCAQYPVSDADNAIDMELTLTLMHLAAVYADHPDYNEEWRP
jgi:hypothetical protein